MKIISISGLWLRSNPNGKMDVLIERDGKWHTVISASTEQLVSIIVEPRGMISAPEDEVTCNGRDDNTILPPPPKPETKQPRKVDKDIWS